MNEIAAARPLKCMLTMILPDIKPNTSGSLILSCLSLISIPFYFIRHALVAAFDIKRTHWIFKRDLTKYLWFVDKKGNERVRLFVRNKKVEWTVKKTRKKLSDPSRSAFNEWNAPEMNSLRNWVFLSYIKIPIDKQHDTLLTAMLCSYSSTVHWKICTLVGLYTHWNGVPCEWITKQKQFVAFFSFGISKRTLSME